jgi:hypothetical protein
MSTLGILYCITTFEWPLSRILTMDIPHSEGKWKSLTWYWHPPWKQLSPLVDPSNVREGLTTFWRRRENGWRLLMWPTWEWLTFIDVAYVRMVDVYWCGLRENGWRLLMWSTWDGLTSFVGTQVRIFDVSWWHPRETDWHSLMELVREGSTAFVVTHMRGGWHFLLATPW